VKALNNGLSNMLIKMPIKWSGG